MQIVSIPNPVLFQKAKPVKAITPKVIKLIDGMKVALAKASDPKGVGLAAPQVGHSIRLFVIRLKETEPFSVFINPEITRVSETVEEEAKLLEGCLSIPNIWGPVKRHKEVIARYQTIEGQWEEKTFTGLAATTYEHEMDHLDGKLFTARVIEQKGKLYRLEHDKEGEEVFKEITI